MTEGIAQQDVASPATGRRGGATSRAGVLTLATIVGGAGNYLYGLLLTHHIAPAQYSIFAAAQSLLLLNGIIGGFGVSWVLAREVSLHPDDPESIRKAVSFAFWSNLVIGGVLSLVIGVISATFSPWPVVLLLAGSTWLIAISSTLGGVLQGEGRMGALAARGLVEIGLKLVSGVLLALVWHTAAAAMTGALIGVAPLYAGWSRLLPMIHRPQLTTEIRGLWRSALKIGRLQIGYGIMSSIDTVLVTALPIPSGQAALYQAAATLGRIPLFVSGAVSAAVYPILVQPANAVRGRVEGLLSYVSLTCFSTVLLVTVPRSVLALVFPASYVGLKHWLPFVAVLGAGLGLFNLVLTFFQGRLDVSGAGRTVVTGVVVALGGAFVGAWLGGITGLNLAVSITAWVTTSALLLQEQERAAWRTIARRQLAPRLAPAVAGAVLLPFLTGAAPWLVLAFLLGLLALRAGFPEFRLRLPRRG